MAVNKNQEPNAVVTKMDNGLNAVHLAARATEMPVLPGPDTLLYIVSKPSDALRPPILKVSKKVDAAEVLRQRGANPRANLYLV